MPNAKKKATKKKFAKINKSSEIKTLEKKIDILYNRLDAHINKIDNVYARLESNFSGIEKLLSFFRLKK
jgi:predicted  nucleic acid-binding Zn-ribbon protein